MELSLREIKNEIQRLNNQIEFYLEKKQLEFERTQPKERKLKEVLVQSSIKDNDPFGTYMINCEKYDKKIYDTKIELAQYEKLLSQEILRMKKYDDLPLIVFYKEECNWSFSKIDRELNYADGSCKMKYYRYKKGKKNERDN